LFALVLAAFLAFEFFDTLFDPIESVFKILGLVFETIQLLLRRNCWGKWCPAIRIRVHSTAIRVWIHSTAISRQAVSGSGPTETSAKASTVASTHSTPEESTSADWIRIAGYGVAGTVSLQIYLSLAPYPQDLFHLLMA
jgi:hypothetical protein